MGSAEEAGAPAREPAVVATQGRGATAAGPPDVAVIGAGAFGAWIALELRRAGRSVLLLDAHGAGHARASSGGETRLIRAGYGADELYAAWAMRSLPRWREIANSSGEALLHQTGVLWMARDADALSTATLATLDRLGIPHERLGRRELDRRHPQIDFGPVTWAILETNAGVLMARRAVQAVARAALALGVGFEIGVASAPTGASGRAQAVPVAGRSPIAAGTYVFALGPWLGKVFPALLGRRVFPTRQEVFYFGPPAGASGFGPPAMPAWIDFGAEVYGVPDIDGRGFKIAIDRHGPAFDPDSGERTLTPATLAEARAYLSERFPALRGAPLLSSEVCQYENTSNGDFLIDRHPDFDNVWLVGGGSGHGFKHGPAVGETVAACIAAGSQPDERFRLANKSEVRKRTIF